MGNNRKREILREAIYVFGQIKQLEMFYEEVGELLVAINQFKRGRVDIDAVREEIADVKIMIEQLAIIFGEISVDDFEEKKLTRLKDRISEHLEKCKTK